MKKDGLAETGQLYQNLRSEQNLKRAPSEDLKMLVIIRLDAQRVFERIKYREAEYMHYFSAKRTREHFASIFKNRFDSFTVENLLHCGEEVIVGIDQFYNCVDELRWYLMVTEDMPGKVQEYVSGSISQIEEAYNLLQLYISVELGLKEESALSEMS
jgi:hypothetical protein